MKNIVLAAAIPALSVGTASAQLAVGPAGRDFIPAILDAGPVASVGGLASELKAGERLSVAGCSCSSAVGVDGSPQAVACSAPAGAGASVRRYRNATGEQGLVLSLSGLSGLTGLDVPYGSGFSNIVLTRASSRGSVPFENASRQPFEAAPGPFGPSKPYSDVLSQTYTRAWEYGAADVRQTDSTVHRLEKLGIVYRNAEETTRLSRSGDGGFSADLDLTVDGVDRLSAADLATLKDSGVYALAGLYEPDRQLTRRYRATCVLEKR